MTSLEDQLLITRQAARITELELWLALLVMRHGEENGAGSWRYEVCNDCISTTRQQRPKYGLAATITYDIDRDVHVIDVL